MTFPLLPLISSPTETETIAKYAVTGKVLFPLGSVTPSKHFVHEYGKGAAISVDATASSVNVDKAVELLNIGIKQLFIDEADFELLISVAGLPSSRFVVKCSDGASPSPKVLESKASLLFSEPISDSDFIQFSAGGNRPVYLQSSEFTEASAVAAAKKGYIPIINASQLTTESVSCNSNESLIPISAVFIATLTTDRPDGLYTTLINGPAPAYTALGVVYSSKESIAESIAVGEGVYQSRKRREELWYKGKTSGATQKLIRLERDCDSDLVKFTVEQKDGTGFCHLENNHTCFFDGDLTESKEATGSGLPKLDGTLIKRFESAPEGSYTKRLFNDESLLVAKLKEELDELIEAGKDKNQAEVAWEAADLLYFVMVWCIKNGVRLSDIERNLDIKSLKVTRRKGDAKTAYVETSSSQPKTVEPIVTEDLYRMKIIDSKTASASEIEASLTRPVQSTNDIMKLVLPIIKKVQANGDKALLELTEKFDGVKLEAPVLNAPFPEEYMQISEDMKEAIDISIQNIEKFHTAQLPQEKVMTVETCPGVYCSRFAKPIENVGLYVPGGTAVLPSTAMMLGVPAKVAGCKNIVFASPPSRSTGRLTPEVVYVAHKLGVKSILMAGGSQAITAMAYGTESVLKCDKILGPGNQFVTAAKMYVQNDTEALCSIDMPAGPSEVLVVADEEADADFVASDLLSQAEHGVDSQVILIGVGLTPKKLAEFEEAVKRQACVLPRREIVHKSLAHSYILLVDTYEEAFELSNKYAPEHLILQITDAQKYVPDYVENAGSVFVGALSPESCGDYSSGTNHTLPTYGYARQYSGVNTSTYLKFITAQNVSEEGLKSIGKAVMTLAAVEGLEAHRNAVQVRMDKLGLL